VSNTRETNSMRRADFIAQIIRHKGAHLQAESCKIDP